MKVEENMLRYVGGGLRGESWAWICSRYTVRTYEIAKEQEKEVLFISRKAKGIWGEQGKGMNHTRHNKSCLLQVSQGN